MTREDHVNTHRPRAPVARRGRSRPQAALVVLFFLALASPAPGQDEERDARATRADSLAELGRRIELLAAELERLELGEVAAIADQSQHGLGPAASKIYRTERGVSIGGYGEMLFEHYAARRDDDSQAGRTDQLDFLRAIVYFGYKWSDRWLLNSEIEIEHASTDQGGSVSVEFAYVDHLWRPELGVRAGLLLVPVGLTNELHEPTVFLGARRPELERAIIPTTWRENGAGVFGDIGDWSYRTYVVNGLDARGFDAGGLRGGRQKGARAKADGFAWVGRLDWTGRPGLLAGASIYTGHSGQGLVGAGGRTLDVRTTIAEGHLDWQWRGLRGRALGAHARVNEAGELSELIAEEEGPVAERLWGYYLELGYDLFALWPQGESSLLPYVRWEKVNTQDRVPPGFSPMTVHDVEVLSIGLAYRPIDPVVLKADYQGFDNRAGTGLDQLNVAFGYIF